MFSYDQLNRLLTIDSMEFCTQESISEWVDSHISDVLDGQIRRSYLSGKYEITVSVVCHDFVVAFYIISDGRSDQFHISSLGYNKAMIF